MNLLHLRPGLRRWFAAVAALAVVACGGGNSGTFFVGNPPAFSQQTPSSGAEQQLANAAGALLLGLRETPPTASTARGIGSITVDPITREMVATVVTMGVGGAAAYIQSGLPGAFGPVVFPLVESAQGSGIWTTRVLLTADQLNAMRASNWYFNVLSANYPNGEIRGQIVPQQPLTGGLTFDTGTGTTAATVPASGTTSSSGSFGTGSTASGTTGFIGAAGTSGSTAGVTSGAATGSSAGTATNTATGTVTGTSAGALGNSFISTAFIAALAGSQALPANSSPAAGAAAVLVDPNSRLMIVAINTSRLTGTSARLRGGSVDGMVEVPLLESSIGSGVWVARATLSDAQLNALQSGEWAAEVTSSGFPAGEIRGQLQMLVRTEDNTVSATGIIGGATGSGATGIVPVVPFVGSTTGSGLNGSTVGMTGLTGTGTGSISSGCVGFGVVSSGNGTLIVSGNSGSSVGTVCPGTIGTDFSTGGTSTGGTIIMPATTP